MIELVRETIAPGIERLIVPTSTLPPATSTNAWLLGEESLTVVDPGASDPEVQQAMLAALADDHVEQIVLTHHHPDHTSGARHLAGHTDARILAHADTAPFFGPIDQTLHDGQLLKIGPHTWSVVHTPGHAHGHICLVRAADGYAVVGDLLAGEGTILIAPPEGHLATYLHSLARLKNMGVHRALPGHGPPLDAQASLELYIHHRNARSDQVRDCLKTGLHNKLEMAQQIYADLPAWVHPMAARQLAAHLTWWMEQGSVSQKGSDHYDWGT